MLKVQQFHRSVFVVDPNLGDLTVYAHKFASMRAATRQCNQLCREIASGLPRDKLSIAADIEARMEAAHYLPPAWR